MNVKLKKLAAAALAMSMLIPVGIISGCSKSNGTEESYDDAPLVEINDDTPWYTSRTIAVGSQYDQSETDYLYCDTIGVKDGNFVFWTQGSYKYPEDFDWETATTEDYLALQINSVDVYDENGGLVNSININDIANAVSSDGYAYVNRVSLLGDDVVVDISSWDERTYEDTLYRSVLNLEDGTYSDPELANSDDESELPENCYSEGTTDLGDYSVTKYWISSNGNGNNSYLLDVTDADGNVTRLDLRDEFPDENIYDILAFIKIDDTTALVPYSSEGAGYTYLKLDLANCTIEEYGDASWLDDVELYNTSYIEGIGNIISDTNGIRKLDFDAQECPFIFRYDFCNVNRYDVRSLSLVDFSEDRIIFSGTLWRGNGMYGGSTNEPMIIILDRAESNPNAGKEVLTAAVIDYLNYPVAEAICRFNESSSEYFISLDMTYSYEKFAPEIEDYDDVDWTQYSLDVEANLSNQLSMDLLAGDGPDIIIDAISYSQLNNPDYLMDISSCIGSGNYLDNVVEASRTGDAIYQIPLTIAMRGIATDADNVEAGQVGFTFEQYAAFVDEVCNGTDPMGEDQLGFFTDCLSSMSDLFIDGNTVNFSNEAFTALAEYTRDNVDPVIDEDAYYEDVWYEGMAPEYEEQGATTVWLNSFAGFVSQFSGDVSHTAILGFPSYDGRGPELQIDTSVAVAAGTEHPDACREFVSYLLSDEIQELFANDGETPLNIDAMHDQALEVIDGFNASVDENLQWYTEAEIIEYGIATEHIDESAIDAYIETLESCSNIAATDAAVVSIVREEIPAFFEGQKTLSEVVDILEDRVQTFLNERG